MRVCNGVSLQASVNAAVDGVHVDGGNVLLVSGGCVHVVGRDSDGDVVVRVAAVVHGLGFETDWDILLGCVGGLDVYLHELRDIVGGVVVYIRDGISLKFKKGLDLLEERFIGRDLSSQRASDDF